MKGITTLATEYDEFPQTLYFLIGCLIPLLMIVISYLVIWIYVKTSASYLKANG